MTNEQIIKELEMIEAMADTLKERAISLREKLNSVSTAPNFKRVKYAASAAKVLANRNKVISDQMKKK